jgi:hypothetical protein
MPWDPINFAKLRAAFFVRYTHCNRFDKNRPFWTLSRIDYIRAIGFGLDGKRHKFDGMLAAERVSLFLEAN